MEIKKIFLNVYSEKKWLEQMGKKGYVLKRHKGVSYLFEKSENKVFYRYIFLKNGRKSFIELDHKSRDPKCRFIYGNGFVALFCRDDDYPSLLPDADLKMNYLKHRQGRQTAALCYIASCCAFIMGGRAMPFFFALSAVFAALAVVYFVDVKKIDKMIEEL